MRTRANVMIYRITAAFLILIALAALGLISKKRMAEDRYQTALSLMESGEYEAAAAVLESGKSYKDSAERLEACRTAVREGRYAAAMSLMKNGEYEAAIAELETIEGYKDAAAQIETCRTAIRYTAAVKLMERGDYGAAIAALKTLNGYGNSEELIGRCEFIRAAAAANAGDVLSFGSYEQDNILANGKEKIEWIVLAREDHRVLVISRYALDVMEYNKTSEPITWETCSLREWLNGEFLQEAFSAEEQAMIPTVTVPPAESLKYRTDPGNAVEDRVFVLSVSEFYEFFSENGEKACRPTAYAVARGSATEKGCGWWWLRSPGIAQNCAARVDSVGAVQNSGPPVNSYNSSVRPVLWIDYAA